MKKIISSLAIALTLTIGFTGISNAQDEVSKAAQEGNATSKKAEEEKL